MNDLIWIGNTLVPRWFMVAIAALCVIVLTSAFVWLTR
jgi:hypothetical protein